MTTPILPILAKEFSISEAHAQRALELIESGHRIPYLARFRRSEVGGLAEGPLRRLDRRRRELDELERRRGTLLKQLTKEDDAEAQADLSKWKAERNVSDRFELEDYFLHHRAPEPEVQSALDKGLDQLAGVLSKVDKTPRPAEAAGDAPADEAAAVVSEQADAPATAEVTAASPLEAEASEAAPQDAANAEAATPEEDAPAPTEVAAEPAPEAPAEAAAEAPAEGAVESEAAAAPSEAAESAPAESKAKPPKPQKKPKGPPKREPYKFTKIQLSPELALACEPFVTPDRGVHTEIEAIEGAARILADRVARDPSVRAMVRRLVRKHGSLAVYPVSDDKRLSRYKALLKAPRPLRQLQGHKLLELRQAQQQRLVSTTIDFDPEIALGKVQAKVCRQPHEFAETFVRSVCEQALVHRILPMVAEDIRTELRERAEEEGMRRISQVLRQVLLSPVGGRKRTAGLHVDAKGDWTIVAVDHGGAPSGEPQKIEASSLPLGELAQKVQQVFSAEEVDVIAVSAGKGSRGAIAKLREALHALRAKAPIVPVSEAGLNSYANSELARRELAELSVPARIATSLARRFQDPLAEFVKCEARHLVTGKELGAIGKANLRRVLSETVEGSVAMVGCDVNEASVSLLRHVPGVDFEIAQKIVERRDAKPVDSLEELRELLPEQRWTNASGFLRVREASAEPLDRTSLHPDQYDFVRGVLSKYDIDLSDSLGRKDGFRGLKKSDFEVDEFTWRDLVRELSFPGRDPRLRNFPPRYLAMDTDPQTIEANSVIEGVITNVSSFGAFVDVGLAKDGMIHISEAAGRYVSDVRTLLSVGQVVRARVTNASGPRIELSLKEVPALEKRQRGGGGSRRRRDEGSGESWPQFQPMQRVATARRDGLGGKPEKKGRGRGQGRGSGGGGGGRPGGGGSGRPGGGGGGRRGGPRDRREKGENYDRDAIKKASGGPGGFKPFEKFFKKDDEE